MATAVQTSNVPGSSGLSLTPFLSQLQQEFGSFDPNSVQTRRREYYSYVAYPTAGQATFSFFSTTIGQSNRQLTNIQRSGHLDNPLIVRAIRTGYFLQSTNHMAWAGTDASTLYSDIVNGFFQVGVLRLFVGSKEWMQLPSPFLYAPPAYGSPQVVTAGWRGTTASSGPMASLPAGKASAYVIDPAFMIGSDQNFQVTIEFPSGLVPVIASTIVPNNTTLYIGIGLDGVEVRPVQ